MNTVTLSPARALCWLRGHQWSLVTFTFGSWYECVRCGERNDA